MELTETKIWELIELLDIRICEDKNKNGYYSTSLGLMKIEELFKTIKELLEND